MRQPLSQWSLQKGKGNSAHDNSIYYLITVFNVQKFQGVLSLWILHESGATILNPQHQHTQCLKDLSVTNPQSHFRTPNPAVHTFAIDQNNLGIKNYKKNKSKPVCRSYPSKLFHWYCMQESQAKYNFWNHTLKDYFIFYNHFFSPLAH